MGGSFKSGAGTLDFEETDQSDESADEDESISELDPKFEAKTEPESSEAGQMTEDDSKQDETGGEPTASPSNKYPYFVRRNSVGDERSTRLELHVLTMLQIKRVNTWVNSQASWILTA
jgi:hypothetical protein